MLSPAMDMRGRDLARSEAGWANSSARCKYRQVLCTGISAAMVAAFYCTMVIPPHIATKISSVVIAKPKFHDDEGFLAENFKDGGNNNPRFLTEASSDRAKCHGRQKEMQECNIASCYGMVMPIDCKFADWADWENCQCSSTRQRYRPVAQKAQAGGKMCSGSQRVVQACIPDSPACGPSMIIDCTMSDWRDWSECTKTCGGGQQDQSREILKQPANGGQLCIYDLAQTRTCSTDDCPGDEIVDCKWGPWFGWSQCTATCGGGTRHRTKEIEVSAKFGGRFCQAATTSQVGQCMTMPCDPHAADCEWSPWDSWSSCSTTCGGGEMYRTRSIARETQEGGAGCEGVFEDFKLCHNETCPPSGQDCLFGDWLEWSACSATCQGHQSRTRAIAVQAHAGGNPCAGFTMEVEPCNMDAECQELDVDCAYDQWAAWSPCSHSCSGGNQMRRRDITTHAQGRGRQCDADMQELKICNVHPCSDLAPVDCQWSHWNDWSMCTVTCGEGQFRRHRAIVLEARNNGRPCADGSMVEMGTCKNDPCIEEESICEWEPWGSWTDCQRGGQTVACGGGQERRSRTSTLVKESVNTHITFSKAVGSVQEGRRLESLSTDVEDPAATCKEIQDDLRPCAESDCRGSTPLDCIWASWSMWSSCPCVGVKERHRVIASYAEGGGNPCNGPEVEAAPCKAHCEQVLSQDCHLNDWTDWSGCPVTCGGGVSDKLARARYRTIKQFPLGKGEACEGKTKELRPCNLESCPEILDCLWGQWSSYSACSLTCGGGEKSRSRMVEQIAAHGGKPCNKSVSMMVSKCHEQPCPTEARDCEFSPWADWGECSTRCGGGEQNRVRSVLVEETAGGMACAGVKEEFRMCGTNPCGERNPEVPCIWGPWTHWSDCTSECNGHQERNRVITQFASNGGPPCVGGERDVHACNTVSAECVANRPKDCTLSEWSQWTTCSHACNGGQSTRGREIQAEPLNSGKPCEGSLFQTAACNMNTCPGNEPVDCEWGVWDVWSLCSRTCGGGQTTRHREFEREASAGGKSCKGKSTMETKACNTGECFGHFEVCGWSEWGKWTICSTTCGGGQLERVRQKRWIPSADINVEGPDGRLRRLLAAPDAEPDQEECIGSQKATRACAVGPCGDVRTPVACEWAEWSEWGPCSCQGLKERERDVSTPPANNGPACLGSNRLSGQCSPPAFCSNEDADCKFSLWSMWSDCTKTCGGGQRYHTRSVAHHAKSHGGGCQGSLEEVDACGQLPCEEAIDCEFAQWSDWGSCSYTCDGGQHIRSRGISRFSKHGGKSCTSSPLEEMASCNLHPCSASTTPKVDCTWAVWSMWSACSKTCGVGISVRSRDIVVQSSSGGRPCNGDFKGFRNCTEVLCEDNVVDCEWMEWTNWGKCSEDCAGHQERFRKISRHARSSGALCEGAADQLRSCEGRDAQGCAKLSDEKVNCAFSPWSEWSPCSQPCSGGQQEATRTVIRHAVGLGLPCNGSVKDVTPCNIEPCAGEEPVDCQWEDWTPWNACSVSCGGGEQSRHRSIKSESRRGGRSCDADRSAEYTKCQTFPCDTPEFCAWTVWVAWSQCSATCDGGEKQRHRSLQMAKGNLPLTEQLSVAEFGDSIPEGIQAWRRESLVYSHGVRSCLLLLVAGGLLLWFATPLFRRELGRLRMPMSDTVAYAALPTEEPLSATPSLGQFSSHVPEADAFVDPVPVTEELSRDEDEECPILASTNASS